MFAMRVVKQQIQLWVRRVELPVGNSPIRHFALQALQYELWRRFVHSSNGQADTLPPETDKQPHLCYSMHDAYTFIIDVRVGAAT